MDSTRPDLAQAKEIFGELQADTTSALGDLRDLATASTRHCRQTVPVACLGPPPGVSIQCGPMINL